MKTQDLPITPVDSTSPIPLYYQIEADLKHLISSEKLPAGALLPPEVELCRAYGVGRHTMRAAIGRLVNQELVERFAGRGTFVKSSPDRRKFSAGPQLYASDGGNGFESLFEDSGQLAGGD